MNLPASVLVGCTNKLVWVRLEGKGSFQNSSGLKDFAKEMINRGYREFIVDLGKCPVMDSTFMGTLAMIALKLKEIGQGGLRVINLNPRNADLLRNLGLDQLFTLDSVGATGNGGKPQLEQLAAGSDADRVAKARTMLEGHEALVQADPQNLMKFKDVLDYLRQDLRREVSK